MCAGSGHAASRRSRFFSRRSARSAFIGVAAVYLVSLVIYGVLGTGLFLYTKNKVGPRFWTITSVLGVGFGWLSHFGLIPMKIRKSFKALTSLGCRLASCDVSPYLDVGVDRRHCLRRLSVDTRNKAGAIGRQPAASVRISDVDFRPKAGRSRDDLNRRSLAFSGSICCYTEKRGAGSSRSKRAPAISATHRSPFTLIGSLRD